MPLAKVLSCAVVGLEGEIVECEVDVSRRGEGRDGTATPLSSTWSAKLSIGLCRRLAPMRLLVF